MKDFTNQREKARYYRSLSGERKTEAFCEMLEESEMTVFLGGAGVSTESGIPDFRSKNGLYRKSGRLFSRYKPEYLLSNKCLSDRPELFFPTTGRTWTADMLSRMTLTKCLRRWRRMENWKVL